MFSRISEIGKSLSDEVTRISEEVSTQRRQSGRIDPKLAQDVLNKETPDPESITKPEELNGGDEEPNSPAVDEATAEKQQGSKEATPDNDKKAAEPSSPAPSSALANNSKKGGRSAPDGTVPGTNVKYSELSPDIAARMRKFVKYEQKYPLLFEAYKVEKKKTAVIKSFEDALKEETPLSSIADVDSFNEYMKSQSSKMKLVNNELRRYEQQSQALKKENDNLKQSINEVRISNRDLRKEIRELKEKVDAKEQAATAEPAAAAVDESQVKDLEEKVAKLGAEKEGLKKEQAQSNEQLAELKKDLEIETKKAAEAAEAAEAEAAKSKADYEAQISKFKAEAAESESLKLQVKELESSLESSKKLANSYKEQLKTKPTSGKKGKDGKGNMGSKNDPQADAVKLAELKHSLEESNAKNSTLREQLDKQSEEVENLKDMLRDVGDELVETKRTVKELQAEKSGPSTQDEEELQHLRDEIEEKKTEMEMLRVQNSAALRDYEQTKNSLTKKYKVSVEDNEMLKKNIVTLEKKNKALEASAATAAGFEKIKTDLEKKERALMDSQNRANILREERDKLNKSLLDLNIQVKTLSTDQHAHEREKNELLTKVEKSKSEHNEMMLKMNKIVTKNNKLVKEIEELRDKYSEARDSKSNTTSEAEALKKRTEEIMMRNREFESTVDLLQEELSQTRTMLQERTREAGTMRKLLMENEDSQSAKVKELDAKLRSLVEENEKLENIVTMGAQRKKKEVEELTMKLNQLRADYDHLRDTKEEMASKLKKSEEVLRESMSRSNTPVSTTNEPDEYTEKMVETLRHSLQGSESRVKELEELNGLLQRSSNENTQKLIRMNKKYKLLTQQYRKRVDSAKSSPLSSRHSSIAGGPQPDLDQLSSPKAEEEDAKEKAVYIKNVLLGFLEHREQRGMLLPVIKTLLYLSEEDEHKLLDLLE